VITHEERPIPSPRTRVGYSRPTPAPRPLMETSGVDRLVDAIMTKREEYEVSSGLAEKRATLEILKNEIKDLEEARSDLYKKGRGVNPASKEELAKRFKANKDNSSRNLFCKHGDGVNGELEEKHGGKKITGCGYICRTVKTMEKHLNVCKYASGKKANETREHPPAPEGWSGPFVGYYLWKNANNRRVLFDSFDDAVVAAEKNDDCCGITRTTTGKYSLRAMKGGEPIGNGPDKVEVSWVIGVMSVPTCKITPHHSRSQSL